MSWWSVKSRSNSILGSYQELTQVPLGEKPKACRREFEAREFGKLAP